MELLLATRAGPGAGAATDHSLRGAARCLPSRQRTQLFLAGARVSRSVERAGPGGLVALGRHRCVVRVPGFRPEPRPPTVGPRRAGETVRSGAEGSLVLPRRGRPES